MTIRIAVIGAGIMGADHARIVAVDIPGATLQVVCDMDAARARQIADTYGAVDAATDPEGVVARSDVDAVIIASPDFTHAPLSRACIAVGKKVLCEKPLSQSSVECLDVMAAEQAAGGRHVMLGFMRRYDPAYIQMRAALEQGQIGRALMLHNWHRNASTPAADFTGAMAITNAAPHEFDILRYLLASEATSITAQPTRSDDKVAPVVMVLETAAGQIVTIEVNNNAAYGYDVKAELVGEAGSISTKHVSYTQIDKDAAKSVTHDPDWRDRYAEAYRQQDKAFIAWVGGGAFPERASSAWDGYAAAVIAETGVTALDTGNRQPITLISKPEFYL